EVLGDDELPVAPQPTPAAAAALAGRIEVGPFAAVVVVVVDNVPIVDDQAARPLEPDVDGARGQRLFLPRLERRAVHPVGDAVVLPGEVVEAFAHEAAVDAEVFLAVRAGRAGPQLERARGFGRQVGLEDAALFAVD